MAFFNLVLSLRVSFIFENHFLSQFYFLLNLFLEFIHFPLFFFKRISRKTLEIYFFVRKLKKGILRLYDSLKNMTPKNFEESFLSRPSRPDFNI